MSAYVQPAAEDYTALALRGMTAAEVDEGFRRAAADREAFVARVVSAPPRQQRRRAAWLRAVARDGHLTRRQSRQIARASWWYEARLRERDAARVAYVRALLAGVAS